MKYELHVEAHTPRGSFEGRCHEVPVEELKDLKTLRDRMQANGLRYLVLYSPGPSGRLKEVALPEEVLNQSVLVYDVRPVEESTTS